jgi:hypothetical protein
MNDEEFGTTDDYCRAFKAVQTEGIADKHLALLQAHFNPPEHTVTWEQLAAAVGYDGGRAVNLHYGTFAGRIARELGLRNKPPDPNRNRWWLWVLVRWAEELDSESGHTAFVLRRPVVEALQRAGIVPFKDMGENAPLSCPGCRSKRVATIFWGLPANMSQLEKDIESGRVVLGGCEVSDGDPKWHCVQCGHEWGLRGGRKRSLDSPRRRKRARTGSE